MTTPSVAIRLDMQGKDTVKSTFEEIASTGDATARKLVDSYNRASDDVEAAIERQAKAQARVEALMPSLTQRTVMANAGTTAVGGFRDAGGGSSQAQNATAAQWNALLAEGEKRANALRAAIDPLWAAEQRYDQAIKQLDQDLARGVIGEDLHGAAVRRATTELEQAKRALGEHSNALGLNRTQFMIAESAVHRFVDSVLAGQGIFKSAMMQMGDFANVLAMGDGGVAGGLAKVRALITPVTVGISAAGAAVLIGAGAWLTYANAIDRFDALAQGSGRIIGATGQDLEAFAERASSMGDISVSAARDIEAGYVQMGGIGKDVLVDLTAMTTDYAKATGVDTKAAVQELGAAMQDPAKGADELTAKFGILTQAQIEHIKDLAQQNDLYGAQAALLKGLQPAFDGAAEHANILARAWRGIETAASSAWTAMGKAIDIALGGGSTLDRLNEVMKDRQSWVMRTGGLGDTSSYDKQIADLQAKLQQERRQDQTARARSQAVAGMAIVDQVTGGNPLDDLKKQQAAVNAVLADGGKAAGLTADQFARAKDAQDALTRAVKTYIPEGEKQVQLAKLDAQIAGTKDPARKAELTAQRERVEQAGKVITASNAEAIAIAKGTKAREEATRSGGSHAATLAREAASMEASASAALTVADAYLTSSAAGQEAEARRKALTDATRKGIDVDAQVARQLALQVAEGAASGAKSVAQLRDETEARKAANDNVDAGVLSAETLNRALQDESALRPLLRLQTIAHGDALATITKVVEQYRQALAEAHAEEARSQADQSVASLARRVEDAQLAARYAGDTTGAGDIAKARLTAKREADDRGYSDADRARVTGAAVQAALADSANQRAQAAAQMLATATNETEQLQTQLGLVGRSANDQERVLAALQVEQDLRAKGIDLTSAQGIAIRSAADEEVQLRQRVKLATDGMQELTSFGQEFATTVLNKDTWSSWGHAGETIINMLMQEFEKLALMNPLQNLLGGTSLPTLSSLFGGGGGNTADSFNLIGDGAAALHFAGGTDYAPGGWADVGELGEERVYLPRGSQVKSAAQTRQMQADNDRSGSTVNHYYLSGNLLTPDFWQQIRDGDDHAAMRGAGGGAKLAGRDAQQQRRRKLGTR